MHMRTTFLALAAGTAALLPGLANATLGETETSAQSDTAALHGSIKSSTRAVYRVHEITLPSGTTLREYAVAGGTVFAVVWEGPAIPDLRQMFGRYFETYASASSGGAIRRRLSIRQPDFVASASGHMRAFRGKAYLPLALPSGVDVGDLQ